ncbi:MAG TPA: hypothetical protein VHV82_08395 [Sporichthyaceae bacterium]|nr:hypothetical protein [Sporichthyaceae bacterium]
MRNRVVQGYRSIDLVLHTTGVDLLPGFVAQLRTALAVLEAEDESGVRVDIPESPLTAEPELEGRDLPARPLPNDCPAAPRGSPATTRAFAQLISDR